MRHSLTKSTLNASNDTGRTAYCGPVIVSAITGWRVSKVEDAIRAAQSGEPCTLETLAATAPAQACDPIEGTTTDDVDAALGVFGYRLNLVDDFNPLEAKQRPTVWSWMQRPRAALLAYVLAITVGKTGHWICVKGTKLCDTYTDGRWVFAADGPHRGRRILEVYRVLKR